MTGAETGTRHFARTAKKGGKIISFTWKRDKGLLTLSVCCTPDLMAAAAVLLHTVSDPMIPSTHTSL